MNSTFTKERSSFISVRSVFITLIFAGWLLAGWSARAGGISTAYYLTANSYSAAEGQNLTVTVSRQPVSGPYNDWDLSTPDTVGIYLTQSGTYQIQPRDLPSNWQDGYEAITIPAWWYSTTFTIPIQQNTDPEYDRTGTLTVDNNPGVTNVNGYASATITVLDDDAHVGVAIYSGGYYYSSDQILAAGINGINATTIRFVRDYGTSARTINYTLNGSTATAGTDYTPALGTITMGQGVWYVDVPITATNLAQTADKALDVQISGGTYQFYSGLTNMALTILNDFPNISVFETSPTMTRGETTSSLIFYRDLYYPGYSAARTVKYTVSGTATNGVDYTPSLSGSAVIQAGGWAVTNVLTPGTESHFAGTKAVTVTLTNGLYNIVANQNTATIGILEDEPTISVATSIMPYTNTPAFTISRSGGWNQTLNFNFAISGTAISGTDYVAIPTNITLAAGVTSTNLAVTLKTNAVISSAKTVVLGLLTNSQYFLGLTTNAVITLSPASSQTNSVPSPAGRYWRGTGSDPTYWSLVVPLDYEKGVTYDNLYGNAYTLYGIGAWSATTYYHYNATNTLTQTNIANRIAFNNPIVAFGERTGGTPLYVNQPYNFGVYAGDPSPGLISVYVYSRTNFAVAGQINIAPPDFSNVNSWTNFSGNGFQVTTSTNYLYTTNGAQLTTNTFGLATIFSATPFTSWGASGSGGYVLTHTANAQATNYYYLVEAWGYLDNQGTPMVMDGSRNYSPSMLYTLEFETQPAWRAVFLDQPHFDSSPLPPFYAGKTLAEMLTNTPPVTNVVNFTPSAATNLDNSPELRRHPILDQFVADMGNDPIALANYVINEVDLTDPMDYSDSGTVAEQAINPPGVSRGALGTFLEKQGSPVEQCALLVYLLRQAGVPAVYEFPPRNGMKILDARLSRMLKFQVHGGYNQAGQLYTTNTMIAVNYPWVAAYIGTNWVHIFPWLKDYQMTEGLNLYEEMPTNYSNAYGWVRDYVYGKTNLLSLAVDSDNTPRVIFPAFVKQTLLQNHPGISLDDIGMRIFNRRHFYARWQDFPTPTSVTNVSFALGNLTSSAITNISPTLTNIFDTVSVEIYSLTDPTKDIKTGDLRLVDLHNREFYINQSIVSGNVQLNLILLPFRTNITSQFAFGNDTNLLSKEVLSLTLDQYDDQLTVRFRCHRHRALSAAYAIDQSISFLGYNGGEETDVERPLRKGDQAAICMSYGRVTHAMLDPHATDIAQMENTLRLNPSFTNSVSPDVYEGAVMYLAGMSYYEKVSEFDQFNQNLHKVNVLSEFAVGLSKISPARDSYDNLANGNIDPILPCVDMFFDKYGSVGNGSTRPDSGLSPDLANQNYGLIEAADQSAEEHQVLNRFYHQTNAVSTVRLLQLAQSSGAGIVPLNVYNVVAQGSTVYQGQQLQYWDWDLWQKTLTPFAAIQTIGNVVAYITPGPMTNSAYKGMASLVLGWGNYQALISPQSLNGGFGEEFPNQTVAPVNTGNYNLIDNNDDYSMVLNQPVSGATLVQDSVADFDYQNTYNQMQNNNYTLDNYDTTWSRIVSGELTTLSSGTPNQNYAAAFQAEEQQGFVGGTDDAGSQSGVRVSDPVHNITGEFYVNETDLRLPGPLPLLLNRNYSSQNVADNQFGPGWRLNIMPYLSVGIGATNIYAADMDGAVLAYVRTNVATNVWLPTLTANPQLNNNTTMGVGALANRLRDRLVQSVNGSTTNYTLYGADGSVRAFQVMTFNNGILNQTRPYLQKWTDSRGNYYTFAYGTNSSQNDFGEVRRIQCCNGNYLGFYYDIYGHITEAYTGDGRRLYYDYDEYNDLVTVTLPDGTTRSYVYKHATQTVTGGTAVYSTHLIIEEDKPDGRALVNIYDGQRRVTNQLSTAGADLTPIRTATFVYSNNFVFTNSFSNSISGYTLVIDGNNHTNRYDYTNDLITRITDPLGQTVQQIWYPDNATAPGYPRSVFQTTDKRGLVTQFQYDSNGNVTNTITTGDLMGDGIASQTATNTAIYSTNNLPLKITDAAGNSMAYVYDSIFTFLPQQIIRYAGATPVGTNFTVYGNATNVVVNGSLTLTNLAFGLPVRQIRAYGSPDAATNDFVFDGHGFVTQLLRYTGTSDPNAVNTFFYNERGDQVDAVDALGAVTFSDYDALGRPVERDNFDENGNILSWNFNYYNENGEPSWTDGPRYNPEDYVFYDYDGAGRRSTEIHWRSEAKSDGTGVEAPAGYNLYAQSFYQYDPLGNLTRAVDPRGAMTTNTWDALCRLVQTKRLDLDDVTVLSTEGFGYEPGGQVQFHTNALGGVVTMLYTDIGKPEFRSNPDGSTNGWRYYLDGRVKLEIQSNGAYWQTTYDDVNRITTRIFYSAAGTPLATNSVQLDRRGNIVQRVDAGNNVFTTTFDDLDRAKVTAGPAIVTVSSYQSGNPPTGPIIYVTNVLQQTVTNFYDAAGRAVTNINALGEMSITMMDALGRTTSTLVYGSGSLVREKYFVYSADHNSVTVTDGSGASAISHTTYTDNDGHTVLSVAYPATGWLDYIWRDYDLSGNLAYEEHDTSPGGAWTFASYTSDGLNRVISKEDRDYALTTYHYDSMGNLTNRTMPGGLQWQALYNNASQVLQDWLVGTTGTGTRTNTYTYYSSGNSFAGLLQTKTNGRGLVSTYNYDDWLRQASISRTDFNYDHVDTFWNYDARGYATNITEQFTGHDTGADPKVVKRTFDAYGQLSSETVTVNGAAFSSAGQNWDAAGRRTGLGINGANYNFASRADGALIYASDPTGSGSYNYDTTGLLTSRTVGSRTTTITSRDGEGRPFSITTAVNGVTQLTESLGWYGDGTLYSHTLYRPDFTDSRLYSYATLSRRLVQEQLNLNGSAAWTNSFAYDSGVAAGLGVLTQMGAPSSASADWNGGVSPFSRVNVETNTCISYPASGRVNGQSTLMALLDGQPLSVTTNSSGDPSYPFEWRTLMELTPGAHQLKLSASHPSGFFTAWATNSFTNNFAQQTASIGRDSSGNIGQRIWRKPDGSVMHQQQLYWDAKDRLTDVFDGDGGHNGYYWHAEYDGLNRRLFTQCYPMINGQAQIMGVTPTTINQYYDPQVEFLELGVNYGTRTEWKLYGPDLNGRYGGLNGSGGLDGVSPYLNLFNPIISDFRGNILGEVTNGVVLWNAARPTGYGAVPNYRPVALGHGADVAQSSAWRGRWVDITGYYNIGMRLYDPLTGMWLSYDSAWNERDPNYLTFCSGDPINLFDANGRIINQQWQQAQQNLIGSGGFWNNTAAYGISFGITAFNAFSFGNFSKNDLLADQNLAGQISDSQFWAGASLNTGVALTSLAAGGGAGSLATRAVTATGSKVLTSIAAGAAAGFGASATDVALSRVEYAGLDVSYPGTISSDLLNVGFSTVVGGGLGSLQAFAPTPEGVVYLRTDQNETMGDYVGQAKSMERFEARQYEHQSDYPDAKFDFDILRQVEPGTELRYMEEWYMRQYGGSQTLNPNTPLSNDVRAMNDVDFANYMFNVPQIPTSFGGAYQPGPLGGKR